MTFDVSIPVAAKTPGASKLADWIHLVLSTESHIPLKDSLPLPDKDVDIDVAKAALEQITKRLEAQLSVKSSTETRSLTLGGHCVAVLSVVVGAGLVELYGAHRMPLLLAAIASVGFLLPAAILAYWAARPRRRVLLPGRLPDELWGDLLAPQMSGGEFIPRMILGYQNGMAWNDIDQHNRGQLLSLATLLTVLSVPAALLAAAIGLWFP